MVIAPLVVSTLTVGIAKLGDIRIVGRIGGKALAWFVFASLLSLTLGLVLVDAFEPGRAVQWTLPAVAGPLEPLAVDLSAESFVIHTIPASVVDAMARNEILQIVVFCLLFGSAMATLGPRAQRLIGILEELAETVLAVTRFIMRLAPVAVVGALASTVAKDGFGVLRAYAFFLGEFYLGLVILWTLLIGIGLAIYGRRIVDLVWRMREPVLLALSTASSEAAYPKTLAELERFGVSNRIASFVLPMGYSFNLDGSMLYCAFAVMFIAQAYGIELPLSTQIVVLLTLMLMSKGIAGVPRASLVVVAGTLAQFRLPEAGILLLMGIDHFLDMGRSATNVIGNSIAAAVVSRWEGERSEGGHGHAHDATAEVSL